MSTLDRPLNRNTLAEKMVGGGVIALVAAGLIWFFGVWVYKSDIAYALTGTLLQLGILVGVLGLHALAVRPSRT